MTTPRAIQPRQDQFHGHLDACRQCRENPMELCPAGALLLVAQVQSPDRQLRYREHVVNCARCQRHPLNLCVVGRQLLEDADAEA